MKRYINATVLSTLDESIGAQAEIAKSTQDTEVLAELTESSSWVVKLAIIENPIVTEDILQKLLFDSNPLVRNAAKYRVGQIK